jgi:uncharacterized membrane protein
VFSLVVARTTRLWETQKQNSNTGTIGSTAEPENLALYAVAIACWLPVVWLQIRLAAIARRCDDMHAPLTAQYWRLLAWWIALGAIAFFAFLAIFWFMVTKTV